MNTEMVLTECMMSSWAAHLQGITSQAHFTWPPSKLGKLLKDDKPLVWGATQRDRGRERARKRDRGREKER